MKKRTNIELEMELVEEIMRRFGLRTKTAAVNLALRRLANRPMTTEEVLGMRGSWAFDPLPDPPPVEEF